MSRKDQARVAHATRAEVKAFELIDKLRPLDRAEAECYVRENQPDVETIVALAFVRQRMAANASRRDALSAEIADVLKTKPRASTDDVICALQQRAGSGGTIEDVNDDGDIDWCDRGASKTTKKASISKRVSRLRKKDSSR